MEPIHQQGNRVRRRRWLPLLATTALLVVAAPLPLSAQSTDDTTLSTSAGGGSIRFRSTFDGRKLSVDQMAQQNFNPGSGAIDPSSMQDMLNTVAKLAQPQAVHVDQQVLLNLVKSGNS